MALALPVAMGIQILIGPAQNRDRRLVKAFIYLMIAAFISLLVFRIFQPYAFSGPGFFGIEPNPKWVQNIMDQRLQSSRSVDFPPAMQWARRPVWFSLQNMVTWGFGLPLGILAWAGFLWAGARLFGGLRKSPQSWVPHALIWGWTAFYFTWQSLQFNPTMRYELPIYPTLVIFAAWALVALYDWGKSRAQADNLKELGWTKPVAFMVGGVVLLAPNS